MINKSFLSCQARTLECLTRSRFSSLRYSPSKFTKSYFRQFSISPAGAVHTRPSQNEGVKRLLFGGALVGGTLWGLSLFSNRETRHGGMSSFEKEYLHSTFKYVGAGLGLTAVGAIYSFRNGYTYRLMTMNPWAMLGVTLVASVGTMMGTIYTDPSNVGQKHVMWALFMLTQSVGLGSLCFVAPNILARAGLYTVGVVGSLSYVAATAKQDKYLYLGGPILCGMTLVALAAVAPMVLPLGSRALMASESIYLYGGLGVFGFTVLYHTQAVLAHARMVQAGMKKADPCAESLGLYLDFLNIFIRLVSILQGSSRNRR